MGYVRRVSPSIAHGRDNPPIMDTQNDTVRLLDYL